MLKLREQLVTTMDTLKELHLALLNFDSLAPNDKIKSAVNLIQFELGTLTGMLETFDEEIAKGIQ